MPHTTTAIAFQRYDDNKLVKLSQQGQDWAMECLLQRYLDRTTHWVRRKVHREADIADVVQESMLKLFLSLHSFKYQSHFSSWYYRIVLNTIHEYFRKKSIHYDRFVPLDSVLDDHPLFIDQASPEQLLLALQRWRSLNQKLHGLSAEMREALIAYESGALPYERIACLLDCSIGTVRSRLHRARRQLLD